MGVHVLERIASPQICARLAALKEHQFSVENNDWGLTYQKCRYCDRSVWEVEPRYIAAALEFARGLWKYGVRHYACDRCREHFRQFGKKTKSKR